MGMTLPPPVWTMLKKTALFSHGGFPKYIVSKSSKIWTQKSEVVNKALLENIGKTNFSSNLLFSPEYFLDDYNDGVALGEASANRVL